MTDKLRAAAQAALEAITELDGYSRSAVTDKIARDAKQSLRAALAEPDAGPATDLNLSCKSVQKRLATQWGFVPLQYTTVHEHLFEAMAEVWVNGGGDADGVLWNLYRLQDAIERKIEEKNR